MSTAEAVVLEVIKTRLSSAAARPVAEIGCSLFRELLVGWHDLDSEGVTSWLWDQITAGRWSALDVIAHYFSIDRAPDGRRLPRPILQEPNWGDLGALLDLPRLFDHLREQLDSAEEVERPQIDSDATEVERYVLWLLRAIRGRVAVAADADGEEHDSGPATS
jgi:hypothetical protein